MKKIDDVASEYSKYVEKNQYILNSEDNFKQGVYFAQKWFDINEDRPPYYKSILVKCPEDLIHDTVYDYTCVWLAVNDDGDDIYTVCGTNIILQHNPEEWRPINYE